MTEKYIQKIEKDIDNDFKFLKSDIINLIDSRMKYINKFTF